MRGQLNNLSLEQMWTKYLIREDHAYMLSIEWWLNTNKFTSRVDEYGPVFFGKRVYLCSTYRNQLGTQTTFPSCSIDRNS